MSGALVGGCRAAIEITATVKVFSAMVWIVVLAATITMGIAWHRFLVWPNIFFERKASVKGA